MLPLYNPRIKAYRRWRSWKEMVQFSTHISRNAAGGKQEALETVLIKDRKKLFWTPMVHRSFCILFLTQMALFSQSKCLRVSFKKQNERQGALKYHQNNKPPRQACRRARMPARDEVLLLIILARLSGINKLKCICRLLSGWLGLSREVSVLFKTSAELHLFLCVFTSHTR